MESTEFGAFDVAKDPWTYTLAAGLFLFVRYVSRAVEAADHPRLTVVWRRILPLIPELIAVPTVVAGGIPIVADKPIAVRIAVGLWVAYLATKSKKLIGQTMLGDDMILEKSIAAATQSHRPEDQGKTEE